MPIAENADTIANQGAKLLSAFLTRANCDVPTVSVPLPKAGSPRGGNASPPGDNAPTINWRTVRTNLQTLLGTVNRANVSTVEALIEQMPAQQYWGTP